MKGPRNLSLFFEGSKFLRTTDPPEAVRGRWTIGLYRHHRDSDWWFLLKSTHRSEDVVAWYLAKQLLERRMGREDELVGKYLVVEEEMLYRLQYQVQHHVELIKGLDRIQSTTPHFLPLDLWILCERIVSSYHPRFFAYRHWSPQKLPPVRYIGVGYKDHGSISTAPSWKDQMLTDEEDQQSEIGGNLGALQSLLLLLPDPRTVVLMSPKKGRKGESS